MWKGTLEIVGMESLIATRNDSRFIETASMTCYLRTIIIISDSNILGVIPSNDLFLLEI